MGVLALVLKNVAKVTTSAMVPVEPTKSNAIKISTPVCTASVKRRTSLNASSAEIACTYYELVDEFGCFSFNGGQDDACICPGSKGAEHKSYSAQESAPSKFGSGSIKQTELFCDAPFEPQTCPSRSASRTPASGSGSSASRTPSRSRAVAPSASRSRVVEDKSNSGTSFTLSNPISSLTVTNPLTSLTNSLTISNPLTSVVNNDDDDSSVASALMIATMTFLAVLLVL